LGNAANLLRLNQGASAVTGPGLRFDAPGINVAHNVLLSAGAAFNLFGDNDGNGIPETMNSATISGVIAGAATAYLNGTNTTLTLSGNNTMSGGVEVASPMTLQVGASANLGTAYVGIKQGATFRYTGSGSETMTRTAWIDTGLGGGGGTIDVPNSSAALTWNPGGGAINQNLTKTGAGALTLGTLGISGGLLTANGGSLTVNSVISGAATMVQVSSGTLTLNGGNTYGGGTFVNGGTLFLNGSLPAGNNVAVASGATLGGVGTINCPVSLAAGANLSPGVSGVGKLTVASTLALAGTTTMELNKAAGTNDSVASLSSITYGGTLNVSNLGGTLAAGDKFTLFSAVNRLGSFATVNLPPLSGSLYWTNTLAFDGSIQVLSPVNLTPTNLTFSVSGNTMNLSWPASHLGWRLQAQTNSLSVGVNNNWVAIPGSESVTSMALPINPANPTVFYRLVYP
jgi:autotransporter-associated beta strand protein